MTPTSSTLPVSKPAPCRRPADALPTPCRRPATHVQVLVDGRDVGIYDPKWLRRHVALVAQEPVLYARSIRRNIIYGCEEDDGAVPPSQAEVEEAARQANAHEFITGGWPAAGCWRPALWLGVCCM